MSEVSLQSLPVYNIGVVSRLTGVATATLRAWERRYGFPEAVRTHSGHRLYTDEQVAHVRWVKAQVDAGLSAGRAARAALQLERTGAFPDPSQAAHVQAHSSPHAIAQVYDMDDDPMSTMRSRLEAALLQRDLAAADELLFAAVAVMDLSDLVTRVIGPTLDAIGEAWRAGHVDVATEHLATAHLHHRIVAWLGALPHVNGIGPVVLACPPGERHDGGLLMFALLLKRSGVPVAFLGQSMPFAELETFALETGASAVVLAAMLESTASTLAGWPEHMPALAEQESPPVCFGGSVFRDRPYLQERVRGHYLGDDLSTGVTRLNRLLGRSPAPVLSSLTAA